MIKVNDRGLPTESLTGKTFTFRNVPVFGGVIVREFEAEVLASCFNFEYVNAVEVRVPGHGRRTIGVIYADLHG